MCTKRRDTVFAGEQLLVDLQFIQRFERYFRYQVPHLKNCKYSVGEDGTVVMCSCGKYAYLTEISNTNILARAMVTYIESVICVKFSIQAEDEHAPIL
jgi:hypothetical protein